MRGSIKLAAGGFIIGVFITFWILFYHESRDDLANMSTLVVMGLTWAGMAVAAGTRYSRPVRGAVMGFCLWAFLTFWIMPGPEPSNIAALLSMHGSHPDGAMTLVGKGAMWVVAGALIGKTWASTGLFASSYQRTYNPKGLSATAMATKGAVEGAVIGFAMGAFISGLWDIGLVAPDGQSDVVSALMVAVLAVIGTGIGLIAGLKKWYKRALAGATLSCLSFVWILSLVAPTSFWVLWVQDAVGTILAEDLTGMMQVIEQNESALLVHLPEMLLVVLLGAMLGAIRGVDGASRRALTGFTIASGAVFLPIVIFTGLLDPAVDIDDLELNSIISSVLVLLGVGILGGAIALRADSTGGRRSYRRRRSRRFRIRIGWLTGSILFFVVITVFFWGSSWGHVIWALDGIFSTNLDTLSVEGHIQDAINMERTEAGLPPLVYHDFWLNRAAYSHNADVPPDRFNYVSDYTAIRHSCPDGTSGLSMNQVEQWGFGWESEKDLAEDIMTTLVKNRDHRENILNPEYSLMGIDVRETGVGMFRATQNFC
ncbi:MAG: CAP domain-containing protein [Gammaproteobacteria bacterium]|nr:CAP domain-containing protein [Gammaproteobacteria bacterium]